MVHLPPRRIGDWNADLALPDSVFSKGTFPEVRFPESIPGCPRTRPRVPLPPELELQLPALCTSKRS